MSGFFEGGTTPLLRSVLFKRNPLYVQFYVTARCNLQCEQCNVIYANADQEECTTAEAEAIAKNLSKIGTAIVLLTGGEPFIRTDIVDIASAMSKQGVHPRLQTNGLATYEQLDQMVNIGAHDISISLDSLRPSLQDRINGGYDGTWYDAIDKIAYINRTFPSDSFCALGCVLAPSNIDEVEPLIDFATRIGWWVSLVPAHQTPNTRPRSFSSFDPSMVFPLESHGRVRLLLDSVKQLRKSGANLYDSDEYLDDIYRFISGNPIRWRRRNDGVCDSPNLYFAIQPNGDMAVCCDYRLGKRWSVIDPDFPTWYQQGRMFEDVRNTAKDCTGCMYGSFPEITISARYFRPMVDRAALFLKGGPRKRLVPMSTEEMTSLAARVLDEHGLTSSVG